MDVGTDHSSTTVAQSTVTTAKARMVERTTTLAIITAISFVGNLLLVVTICQSASLRRIHFNKHIINLAIINLFTCILAMPMALGYSITNNWDYGDIVCRVYAHFLFSMSIATCLSILVMNLDRLIAVHNPGLYPQKINSQRTSLFITAVWLLALLFPLPLSLDVVSATPFPNRYICSIAAGSSINYLVSLYIVCFAAPPIINLVLFAYIAREALRERESGLTGASSTGPSESILWPEVQTAGVVFIIFLLWLFTELPYFTLTSIEQYIHSDAVNGQISYSADLDTAFMWLKFSNCCILPFIIFKWRKDIWYKFKDIIFCRKSNSIVDGVGTPSTREKEKHTKNKNKAVHPTNPDTPKFEASFPIPTISATKDGLHVHGRPDTDEEIFYTDMNITSRSHDFDRLDGKTAIIERASSHPNLSPGTGNQ